MFYRDVQFLVPIGMQFWLYLSPVYYPWMYDSQKDRFWYFLNPFAELIDAVPPSNPFPDLAEWEPLAWTAVVSVVSVGRVLHPLQACGVGVR